jgi:hypothetical protein
LFKAWANVGAAVAAGPTGEAWLEIGQADIIRPLAAAGLRRARCSQANPGSLQRHAEERASRLKLRPISGADR